MPKIYCFSCLILFGGRSDSCILGDKKAQNESSRALHATWLISLNAATAIGCDKNKGGMPVTVLLNTSTPQSNNYILEISSKNKSFDQKL